MAGILPPFNKETAQKKTKAAQALWNTKDAERVSKAYAPDCIWRNRDQFFQGTEAIVEFLTKKWQREKKYKLRKELFAFTDNKIAVQFWYEYYDEASAGWRRTYGLEDWTFNPDGRMGKRQMSANGIPITEDQRWFKEDWTEEQVDAVTSIQPRDW